MEVDATSKHGRVQEKQERSRSRFSFRRHKKDSKDGKPDRMKDDKQDGSKESKPERSKLGLGALPAGVRRIFSRRRSGRSHSVSCSGPGSKSTARGTVGNVRHGSWDLLTVPGSHVASPSFHSADDSLDSLLDTPIHKCYRSTDERLEASWNDSKLQRCRSATSPASLLLSRDSSFSVDGAVNEENLLDLDDSMRQSLDCDKHLMRIYQFLCSEKSYVDEIRSVFDIYVEPIKKYLSLTTEEMNFLFSDLECLVHSGCNLCKQLRIAVDNWDSKSTQIGHLFTTDFWSLLEAYGNQYIEINRLLRNKRSASSEFAKFCQQREATGCPSLDDLLYLPMKRMAFYAVELKEMTSELDSDHPDMADLMQAANQANRVLKQQRSTDNENYMMMIQERFPHDDLHLIDREIQGYGTSRWKSAARAVQNIGGKKQSVVQLSSSSLETIGSAVLSERSYVLDCPVKLTANMQTQQRHLFLFTDLLFIAKGRTNFRLKHKIRVCDLWVAPCTEKSSDVSVIIGWPTTNIIATFEKSDQKDLLQRKLKELIVVEKAKEIPQSIQIKILRKDCDFTAIKSLLITNTETASHVVERCLKEFHITFYEEGCSGPLERREAKLLCWVVEQQASGQEEQPDRLNEGTSEAEDASAMEFHLCVLSTEDDTTCALSGHECPFSIWMSHVPDCSLPSVDNISSADTKIQFLFRSSKRTPQKVVLTEVNKPSRKGKALKRLFAKPSSKEGHVAVKFFCRDLGDLSEQAAAIPHPVMQMLKKLFFDGPQCDGVFRKSANHAKFQAVKQALDNGEDINFDEMPVLMTAVLLKDFLRNLPNCLLSCQLYQKWIEAVLLQDSAERIASIKRLVKQLPPCNQLLLRHLICVLYNLASHSDTCKMNSSNIAICIGQSLLWSGLSVAQKEDAENANHLVQIMIDSAKDIFGPDCLTLFDRTTLMLPPLLRNFSADSDSMYSIGPAGDSVCNSLDLEFSRSYSEADSSPVVTDRAGFAMQSSQSCDSGLQLGEEVSLPPLSPQLKQLTESREENGKLQSLTKKLRRLKKRSAAGIPVEQQSSSIDDLPSIHSADSRRVNSTEYPLDELAESPLVQRSSVDSATASDLIQSAEPSSMESHLNHSKEPSTSQSTMIPTFQSSKLVQSFRPGQHENKMRTTLSDDSVLESFDETSEESSDAEFLKDVTAGKLQFSTKNLPRNVCEGAQQQSVNPCIIVSSDYQQNSRGSRGLDLDQLRRRPPLLSQLYGTTFAEECLVTPDEPETSKTAWTQNYSPSKAAAAFRMHTSSDSGNFNSDEPCQSIDSVATSPEMLYVPNCTESSRQQSRTEDDVTENLRSRQQASPTRRPLLRTNAVVESDSEKLKQGMTSTGSDLFPSQIKSLLQQSATGNDKQLPSKNVMTKASRTANFHKSPEQRTQQPSTGSRTDNWNRGLPTYEEALQQKAKQVLQQNRSSKQLKQLQDEKENKHLKKGEVLLSHCKSLDDVSKLVTEKRNDLAPLQNRSPSHSSYLNYSSKVQNQESVEIKVTSKSMCSRITETQEALLQKGRKQLYHGDGKKNEKQQMTYKSRDASSECHTSSASHDKYQAGAGKLNKSRCSSSSSALDSEEGNMQEPSCQPRVTRKRVRNRHIRKRFSDPRLNTEKCRKGSELGRSKSDSCELCWNNARKQFQTNLRSMEREHSKENIVSRDQFAPKIKVSDPSVSLRDINRNHEANNRNTNRKSLTVKNKDWHRELSEHYTESESFLSVISPTGRVQMSYSPNRFGREVKEDVAVSTGRSQGLPCININLNVSVTIGSNQSGKDCTDTGLTTRGCCQTESGSGCCFKSQIPRRMGLSRTSDSISKKLPVISVQGQRDNLPTTPLTADSAKISDVFKKTELYKRGNIRPSCETVCDIVDDAVLLNPANISWSVAKLKELYSDQQTSSSIKSPPVTSPPHSLSHSRSEDLGYRRPSALPRLAPTGNPPEKTRKSEDDS